MENKRKKELDYLHLVPTEEGYSNEISAIEHKINEIIKYIKNDKKRKITGGKQWKTNVEYVQKFTYAIKRNVNKLNLVN